MARTIKVKVKKFSKDAIMPSKTHEGDACFDIKAIRVEYDEENDSYIYYTGLGFQTDSFSVMRCYPRSSNSKTNFYLTNSVGTVDVKTYTGEVRAVFKHRDTLDQRLTLHAMEKYDVLPWYKKLRKGAFCDIKEQLREEFLSNPLKWAPYTLDKAVFQCDFSDVNPVEFKVVSKLKNTTRGKGGFGSTNVKQPTTENK